MRFQGDVAASLISREMTWAVLRLHRRLAREASTADAPTAAHPDRGYVLASASAFSASSAPATKIAVAR